MINGLILSLYTSHSPEYLRDATAVCTGHPSFGYKGKGGKLFIWYLWEQEPAGRCANEEAGVYRWGK